MAHALPSRSIMPALLQSLRESTCTGICFQYSIRRRGRDSAPFGKEEIYHIVKKYGEAAKRAKISGFDAVEIHAGHSYLLSQFLSPLTNDRTDEFGGSPENRARFTKLVVEEVRKQVGPNFPIFVRISADEFMEEIPWIIVLIIFSISRKKSMSSMFLPD